MILKHSQLTLPEFPVKKEREKNNRQINKLNKKDRKFHDWYRFVLSFPPHLVRDYLDDFKLDNNHKVLDPFCGTGTTIVECKLKGIQGIGIEAAPFAHFASSVKTDWSINADLFQKDAKKIADKVLFILKNQGIDDNADFSGDIEKLSLKTLDKSSQKLLIKNSISPLPLYKSLVLLDCIKSESAESYRKHALLALANTLVFSISNLHFGPEVGVRKIKSDAPIVSVWLYQVSKMINDIKTTTNHKWPDSNIILGDSRCISQIIPPNSIDAVITSPPYPNEKDYTRTTRLESVILGFMKDINDLRFFKKTLVRSNTRNVYKGDDDHIWIENNENINRIADKIEKRRIELGKNSGFEKLYSTVTRLYFGGMAKHLAELREVLKPGAKLAYVVGDQASYLRIMIKTGKLLSEIAQSLGYNLIRVDLFRKRYASVTKSELCEEVVVLSWNG
ncbi:SAM-dependent methyltransferase [Desulfonema limicola]|uniref:site-specific DNA-methyltransferase (cytosine-N(4)-specific) n=1 Tax=Desulfonema limicola TaxID=45656 RepID=A0A975GGP9_9BACT|nr:DNA methyltransferase [Desulfonema limicola]QTA80488.1 SAM-dependent methyltransferase [Desulfonema limicola]